MDSQINLKGLMTFLDSAASCHLKKRENIRLVRDVALKGILILKDTLDAMSDPYMINLMLVNYFETSLKFCISKGDQTNLVTKFNEVFIHWKVDSNGQISTS
jgi:hypothetical protein